MYKYFIQSRLTQSCTKCMPHVTYWLKEKDASAAFPCRAPCSPGLWLGTPSSHSCLRALRCFRTFVAPPFARHSAPPTTGTRPTNRRVLVPVDRAVRDLAYHFYYLPVDRISWAIPYLPNNLWIQLYRIKLKSSSSLC